MNKQDFKLWDKEQEYLTEEPIITAYIPEEKKSDCAVVILPGGGYHMRAAHEGEGYARFFNEHGICAFVCEYRVSPNRFPIELADSRRAIQFVRYHAAEYGIDKNKIAIMGSSAGGHLAALTSTYFEPIELEGMVTSEDPIAKEDFIPNAQILCYPVIKLSVDETKSHIGSCINLLGMDQLQLAHKLTPQNIVSERTPKCFLWHTMVDGAVPASNSLDYAWALKEKGVSCELHIFPDGNHGIGLADGEEPARRHALQWGGLLLNWMTYVGLR